MWPTNNTSGMCFFSWNTHTIRHLKKLKCFLTDNNMVDPSRPTILSNDYYDQSSFYRARRRHSVVCILVSWRCSWDRSRVLRVRRLPFQGTSTSMGWKRTTSATTRIRALHGMRRRPWSCERILGRQAPEMLRLLHLRQMLQGLLRWGGIPWSHILANSRYRNASICPMFLLPSWWWWYDLDDKTQQTKTKQNTSGVSFFCHFNHLNQSSLSSYTIYR